MTAKRPVPILRDPAFVRLPAFTRLWFIQASTQVGGDMALYALAIAGRYRAAGYDTNTSYAIDKRVVLAHSSGRNSSYRQL